MKRHALYWVLLHLEAAGVLAIFCEGVPLYRRLLLRPKDYPGNEANLVIAAISVGAIQACYWMNRGPSPALFDRRRPVLGHLVIFLSRLNFVFVGSMFTLVFYNRIQDVAFSPVGLTLLVAVLFSVFCFTLELERLGKAIGDPSAGEPPPPVDGQRNT